ncbi:MAG: hypothetical protein QOD30_2271, partial [Actinomycetota bacterium]|nr:hypothetical protein [Actinomycetota bacterium]
MIRVRARRPTACALLGAAAIATVFVSATLAPGAYLTLVIANFVWVVSAGFAALMCLRAARTGSRRWRLGWVLLTATTSLWTLANLGWAFYDLVLREPVPVPSLVDLLFLPAQLFAVGAMVAMVIPVVRERDIGRTIADVVLVSISLTYVLATSLLAHPGGGVDSRLGQAVAWAYPISDLVLIAVALIAISRSPRIVLHVAVPLSLGFAALGIGDSLWTFNVLNKGHLGEAASSALYVVAYVSIAAAARVRRPVDVSSLVPGPAWARNIPYIAVAAAVGSIVYLDWKQPYPAVLGIGVVGALFGRQMLGLRDNHRMQRNLEQRVADRTAALAASEGLFRTMAHTVSDTVLLLDAAFRVTYTSPGIARIGDIGVKGVEAASLLDFVHPDDVDATTRALGAVAEGSGHSATVRVRLVNDGIVAVVDATLTNLLDEPSVMGYMLSLRDVTDENALQTRLLRRAEHDELTGLLNRRALVDRLVERIASGTESTVLLLDLDEFKGVNDSLGHTVGDRLLVAVGARLESCLRSGDVLARLGGDEFAFTVDGGPDVGLSLARRIDEALQLPFAIDLWQLRCRASIGIAVVGHDAIEALRDADLAMYEAKRNGPG